MRSLLSLGLLISLLASPSWASDGVEEAILAGRYADALPGAEKAAASAPSDVAAQERYIDLMRSLGLIAVIDPIYASRAPAGSTNADAHYLRGRSGATLERATEGYRAALAIDSSHARALTGLAHLQRAEGRLGTAEASYRAALATDDGLPDAWSGLGAVLVLQGKTDAALEVGRRAIERVPERGDSYVAVASLDPGSAGDVLAAGLRAIPADPRLHAAMARHKLSLGDGKEAQKYASKALILNPLDPDARRWMMYAKALQDGSLDAAGFAQSEEARGSGRVETWSPLLAGYPRCALLWVERSAAHAGRNDIPAAKADMYKALELEPDNVEAHAALGLLLLDADPAAAKPHLLKASEARPIDASLQIATGMTEAQTGEMKAARKRLKAAVDAHPYDLRALLTYGHLLSAEDPQATYDLMAEAVQRMPDARVVLALVGAAKDAGRLEDAAELLADLGSTTGNPVFADAAKLLKEHR